MDKEQKKMLNFSIKINGIVQGIGFRPFIYRLAHELKLSGFVINTSAGIEIEITADKLKADKFIKRIKTEHPANAEIKDILIKQKKTQKPYISFKIKESLSKGGATLVSPDLAVCPDCLKEMNTPDGLRYNYAFINCTNCGPRYSIIETLPYDRPLTTMKKFIMCEYCSREYKHPLNRRFHAQPIACPKCGPALKLLNSDLKEVKGDPIQNTVKLLLKGKIIGIKGISGFHIACDARNKNTIALLRKKKNRPHKPFALMVHPGKIHKITECSRPQLNLLRSSAAPIVLLKKKGKKPFFQTIAPDNPDIGVFFPYAPLHLRLLNNKLPYLIMTSGNLQDEPVAIDEKALKGFCDYFLTHNRPIKNRADDSIIMPLSGDNSNDMFLRKGYHIINSPSFNKPGYILIRRSRGYVPVPFELPFNTIPTIACGAELKLTFALSNKKNLFVSPYIGNASNKKTMDLYAETIETYKKWFKIKPELAVVDLHPEYFSTRFAKTLDLPIIKVQHHFAHVAAVMSEYGLNEPVIGVSYDGTGYGTDGNIWGCEIMIAEYKKFERKFHLNYMPLPGGDSATLHPARIAYAYLKEAGADTRIIKNISELEKKVISKQLENKFNLFNTSSLGRLFDCVSALLGLVKKITYEGQAAMILEFIAGKAAPIQEKPYSYLLDKNIIDIRPLLMDIVSDIQNKVNPALISRRFHSTIIKFTVDSIKILNKLYHINKVVLSGGVMQNRLILTGLIRELNKNNFRVYYPALLPVNDGSISAGQAAAANASHK